MGKILFHFVDGRVHIKHIKRIKYFIQKIFEKEKIHFNRIDFIFCSDKYLLKLNKKFLYHNYYTDVISFELNEKFAPIIGEVYISIDRVKKNSKTYNSFIYPEILRVIFHGALHLCGYGDKTKKEAEIMKFTENSYLNKFEKSF